MTRLFHHFRWFLVAALILLNISPGVAMTEEELTLKLEFEPPATQKLLKEAAKLARDAYGSHDLWKAAVRYCDAARLGSIEAQYQLGMLYAFGAGVPVQRAYAAALFSMAGQQGHYEAQNMLESIRFESSTLPGCINSAKNQPEKSIRYSSVSASGLGIDIETRVNQLPKSKAWIVDMVKTMSPWYQIDPHLALSIVSVESNFNTNALSPKNAMGLMQIIPATAERFNVKDAFDASQNIKAGLKYLQWLLNRYHGDVALAAAGYNAGEGAVDRHHGVPPYPETQQYVARVLRLYQKEKCC
ncbi:MAG: lytic transglycosylase domain-containing protein [Methylobacter sp.]|nr:lytic transglycosylase domain-containing protein [Methylobacter sp.]MDP2100188.1 lytic transglycosylase domain-containing protein [Methylobacter sp.]MDP2426915.1 lytic transglycosylase domain-containing protein [Methylobacter sp.]MDP3053633.1 lytic transglycosylase domain-containing protein [Methylobacter sp.]MDP3360796.1 lytic transglycosylase domain-containing protein [Methylobacter sp.]